MFSFSAPLGLTGGLLLALGVVSLMGGATPKASGVVCLVSGIALIGLIVYLTRKGEEKE